MSSKCNTKIKNFISRFPSKTGSGTVVDELLNKSNFFIRDLGEIRSFREEKSNNIIHVLIRTTLPRFMGLSKIDGGIETVFYLSKFGELRSVVEANGLNRETLKKPLDYSSGLCSIS